MVSINFPPIFLHAVNKHIYTYTSSCTTVMASGSLGWLHSFSLCVPAKQVTGTAVLVTATGSQAWKSQFCVQ